MSHCSVFKKAFVFSGCFALLLFLSVSPAFSEKASGDDSAHDLFTSTLAQEEDALQPSEGKLEYVANNALVWPFAYFKKGMDKTLNFVEHHRIYDKLDWIYEQFKANGVYNKPQTLSNMTDTGEGAEFDFKQMFRLKGKIPYLKATGGIGWINKEYFRVHTELGVDKKTEVGPYAFGVFNYETRGREKFYGIGPRTSRGDGCAYHSEITTVGGKAGYSLGFGTDIIGEFLYEHANITNGVHTRTGIIDDVFRDRQVISGLAGGDFLIFGTELAHDTRDFPEDPHAGSNVRLAGRFFKDIDGSDLSFFKFRIEAAKYIEVFSERQVLAGRFIGEHNVKAGDGARIPFFHMARLGGNGVYPSLGDTMRGFERNRWYAQSAAVLNLEYRYQIWHYKNSQLEAVIFVDEGEVFNDFGGFKMRNLKTTVGGGLRFKLRRRNYLSFEVAKASEDWQIYLRTTAPF